MEECDNFHFGSDSVTTDSECNVCKVAGKHVDAVSYCQTCSQSYCTACLQQHSIAPETSGHEHIDTLTEKTKDEDEGEKTEAVTEIKLADKSVDRKCPRHDNEILKFFCTDHNFIGCSVCMFLEHKSCKHTEYIQELSLGIERSEEYREFATELETVVLMAECITRKVEQSNVVASKRCEDLAQNIRQAKEKVIRRLDELEKEFTDKAQKILENDKKKFDSAIDKCNGLLKDSTSLISHLGNLKSTQQFRNMFIEIKSEQDHVQKMKTALKTCNRETDVTKYMYYSKPLEDTLQTSDWFGTLKLLDTKTAKVIPEEDLTVKTDSDKETCNISGAVVLDCQKVVLVDSSNKAIKLLDTQQRRVVSELKLPSTNAPRGITQTTNDQIAVTIPKEKKIKLISVANNELSSVEDIEMPNESYWIGSVLEKFIVTVNSPQRLDILDKQGQILQAVNVDKEYQKLFDEISNIIVSRDFSTVYVADQTRHTMTAISLWRKKSQAYSSWYLRGPTNMAVELSGNVYVCGNQTNDVHQTTADCGKKIRIPLTKSDGLKKPQALAFCDVTDRLFVGMESSDVMKVFRMSF